jgi:hypothetical protein
VLSQTVGITGVFKSESLDSVSLIDTLVLRAWCACSRLDLHSNLLSSNIPDGIEFLDKLQHVDLSKNSLTGVIPAKITVRDQ